MDDVHLFFNKSTEMLPLYYVIETAIRAEFEDVRVKVQKTQISFYNKHFFACVSLKKARGWPKSCLVLSLGLNRRLEHPRVAQAVEPYPNRGTHHILVQQEDEVDAELMEWVREAYGFAMAK